MIKILRKYQRTVFGVLVIATAALAMGGFGLGRFMGGGPRERGAITINDVVIPYEEVHRQRRELEDFYRKRFGSNYEQFMEMLKLNVNQLVVDQIIANTLIDQEIKRLGFNAGAGELDMLLRTQVFPGGVDQDSFGRYLRDQRLSPEEFMGNLKRDLARQQLTGMLRDASVASKLEALSVLEREETKYTVSFVTFDPNNYIAKVDTPKEETLQAYYDENSLKYEAPERVAYDYVVFNARDFESSIEIFPEDVEGVYTENISKYELPDEVKVRAIQVTKPKGKEQKNESNDAALDAAKEKAEKALIRAKDGEDFVKLVTEYSDNAATKLIGGEMGWIKRGVMSKSFDNAVFALKGPGIAELVETPEAFLVVEVEEYKEKSAKPLDSVRKEIEDEIRKREAPTYASEQAHKYLSEWIKSGKSLREFASENKLTVNPSGGLLAKEKDPDTAVSGLTRKIFEMPGEERQVVEMGDKSILVHIVDFKEVETPPFQEVRSLVIEDVKKKEANRLAESASKEFLDNLEKSSDKNLEKAAQKLGLKSESKENLQAGLARELPFVDDVVHSAIFSAGQPGLLKDVMSVQGKYYVFQIREINKPKIEEMQKKVSQKQEEVSVENGEILLQSLINRLKAAAKIEVDPGLMVEDAA
ncbi:MAG: hypothetical protein GYA55_10225 [SAR324 cluster bacterium]|uniref:Periplasmic chaperone PpiD n=1 Tax=SAR324 cluster bacterium TaxID=2024889 RepID=A0A7X9FSW1_9DELT|nr:hypothetical protein [SAR324 cluster bacterium]